MAPIGWLWAPRDAEVAPDAAPITPSGRSRCSPSPHHPPLHPDMEPYRGRDTAIHPDMAPYGVATPLSTPMWLHVGVDSGRSGASVEGVPVAAGRAEIVFGTDALAGKQAESVRWTVGRGMEVGAADPVRIDV